MIELIWRIFIPLTLGFGGYSLFMKWRSKNRKVSFFVGFLGWLVLLGGGLLGEFIAHALRPEVYKNIGDNPTQTLGLSITIMLSFILCPLTWWNLRRLAKPKG